MEVIIVAMIFMFIVIIFFILADVIIAFFFGLLLIIILPISALFDGADIVKEKLKKTKVKRDKKVKEDPRDGPTVLRVSKSDLRNRPVNRPTVWRWRQ